MELDEWSLTNGLTNGSVFTHVNHTFEFVEWFNTLPMSLYLIPLHVSYGNLLR